MGYNPMILGMPPMMMSPDQPNPHPEGSAGPKPDAKKDAEEEERKAKAKASWISFCERKGLDSAELRAGFDEWRRSHTEEHISEYLEHRTEKVKKKEERKDNEATSSKDGDPAGALLRKVTAISGKKGTQGKDEEEVEESVPVAVRRKVKKHFRVTTQALNEKDLALELLGKAELVLPAMKKIAKGLELAKTHQDAKRSTDKSKFVQAAITKLMPS